jgi:hypothetical protein
VSGLVSVAFVYKSFLNMAAPLSNYNAVEQRDVITLFGGQKALKRLKFFGEH